jgi:CheY-like chemotaxis protein
MYHITTGSLASIGIVSAKIVKHSIDVGEDVFGNLIRRRSLPQGRNNSGKILVVEDEAFVRSAIVGILHSIGFASVVAVESGAAALQAIKETQGGFPIAVFDISLSDMRIEDLAEQLPASHGIETLVLCSGGTAKDFDSAQAAFERLGVSTIHRRKKPAGMADFKTALLP